MKTKERKTTEKWTIQGTKGAAWIAAIGFLLSIVPILWVAQYAHSAADDYSYGRLVHQAILCGGGYR